MRFCTVLMLLVLALSVSIITAPAVLAGEGDVEIIGLDVGRSYYGSWWSMNAFARTSYIEFNITVQNRLPTGLDAKLIATLNDEVNYSIAYVETSITLPPNTTVNVVFGPVKIENWARIGQGTAHVNVKFLNATAWCPEATTSFSILPPVHYSLTIQPYLTTKEGYSGGRIWVDGSICTMPLALDLVGEAHVLKVISRFYDYRVDGGLFQMFFKSWETGSAENARMIILYGNSTVAPIFAQVRQHLQPL